MGHKYDTVVTKYIQKSIGVCMVLLLGGKSEIGANVRSKFCYLIWLRHLIKTRAVTFFLLLILRIDLILFMHTNMYPVTI